MHRSNCHNRFGRQVCSTFLITYLVCPSAVVVDNTLSQVRTSQVDGNHKRAVRYAVW